MVLVIGIRIISDSEGGAFAKKMHVFKIYYIGTIIIHIGKNNWDLET